MPPARGGETPGPGAVIVPRLTAARRPADPYAMMADRARRTADGGRLAADHPIDCDTRNCNCGHGHGRLRRRGRSRAAPDAGRRDQRSTTGVRGRGPLRPAGGLRRSRAARRRPWYPRTVAGALESMVSSLPLSVGRRTAGRSREPGRERGRGGHRPPRPLAFTRPKAGRLGCAVLLDLHLHGAGAGARHCRRARVRRLEVPRALASRLERLGVGARRVDLLGRLPGAVRTLAVLDGDAAGDLAAGRHLAGDLHLLVAVSYTHLTLPTKRIV